MHLTGFINQKSYEHIVHEVRRHPITFVPAIIIFLILLFIPAGVYWLLLHIFPSWLGGEITFTLLVLSASLYYVSVGIFLYTYFVTFYLNLLIVTNDRLLEITQQGLFARTISELDLYRVQDATSEVKGVFASFFNYGNVTIQTAGAVEKFSVWSVAHPDALRQEILDLAEKDRAYHQEENFKFQVPNPK